MSVRKKLSIHPHIKEAKFPLPAKKLALCQCLPHPIALIAIHPIDDTLSPRRIAWQHPFQNRFALLTKTQWNEQLVTEPHHRAFTVRMAM